MTATTKTTEFDRRTDRVREQDEWASCENWTGFESISLLDAEGADRILEYCRNVANAIGGNALDQTIALGGVKNQPFRWKDKVFRILRCEYEAGEADVEVAPHDDELVAALKGKIENDRFHTLTYYQGFGFICLPEDYQKFQDA